MNEESEREELPERLTIFVAPMDISVLYIMLGKVLKRMTDENFAIPEEVEDVPEGSVEALKEYAEQLQADCEAVREAVEAVIGEELAKTKKAEKVWIEVPLAPLVNMGKTLDGMARQTIKFIASDPDNEINLKSMLGIMTTQQASAHVANAVNEAVLKNNPSFSGMLPGVKREESTLEVDPLADIELGPKPDKE